MIYFLPNVFFLIAMVLPLLLEAHCLYTHIQLEISICSICFYKDLVMRGNGAYYSSKEFCLTRIDTITPCTCSLSSTDACKLLL